MKKKIIIIAIIVVALVVLWRRGVFDTLLNRSDGGTPSDDGTPAPTSNPLDDYRIVIDRTTMPDDVKVQVKALCKSYWARAQKKDLGTTQIDGKTVSIYDLEVKSAGNYGITLAQQCVRSCINSLTTKKRSDGTVWLTKAEAESYMFEVQSME